MSTLRPLFALVIGIAISGVAACGSGDGGQLSGRKDAGVGSGPAAAGCPEDNPYCKEGATLEAGELAVGRRKCKECHDSTKGMLAGNPTNLSTQSGVELYPPNLTNDEETGIGSWGDDQLATAIRVGLDRNGLELCPQMKHFSEMTDFEVYSIVKYLRSVPKVKHKVLRSVCPPLKTKDEQR